MDANKFHVGQLRAVDIIPIVLCESRDRGSLLKDNIGSRGQCIRRVRGALGKFKRTIHVMWFRWNSLERLDLDWNNFSSLPRCGWRKPECLIGFPRRRKPLQKIIHPLIPRHVKSSMWPLVVGPLNSFRSRTLISLHHRIDDVSGKCLTQLSCECLRLWGYTATKLPHQSRGSLSGACYAWWISNWRSNGT